MVFWSFIAYLFIVLAEPSVASQRDSAMSDPDVAAERIIKNSKQSKKHKKKHKSKKRAKKAKAKKGKKKQKVYSPQKIEKIIRNGSNEGDCSRLNCSSKLDVAKSCLKTKADHRANRECFNAFCAYGCNDEDFANKADVSEFCIERCSSKKYLLP
jgi:hypothetical protein